MALILVSIFIGCVPKHADTPRPNDTALDTNVDSPADTDTDSDTSADSDTKVDSDSDTETGRDSDSDSSADDSGSDTAEVPFEAEYVLIPASTFDMGCTPGQEGYCEDDETLHTVTLTHDYYVATTEVTQAQFETARSYNGSIADECGPNCPVEFVTWHEAVAYANALSEAEGLESCYSCTGAEDHDRYVFCVELISPYECAGYRLLTEAEWEGAARCGEDSLYAGSDIIEDVAWYWGNVDDVQPVAGLAPNACGLYDMSGNIAEWVQDWYAEYPDGEAVDPTGPPSDPPPPPGTFRGDRGGAWVGDDPADFRVAWRSGNAPNTAFQTLGFRVGRTAP